MKSLKVLFITSTFPRGKEDVLANWISELALRLKKQGVAVDVLAPSFKGSLQRKYFSINIHRFRYAPARVEVLTQDEGAVSKLLKNPFLIFLVPLYLFFGSLAAIRQVANNHYDVINVHWPFPNGIFGIIATQICSAKLVLTFYGAEFALLKKIPFGQKILRLIINKADQVIADSHFTKRKIQKIENVKVKVIPFGSTISVAEVKTNQLAKPRKKIIKKRLLFVGRLIERKGIAYLIKAMPEILASFNARLDIVGGGDLFSVLKNRVKRLNLEKKIFLHGKVSDKKLKKFYQHCDVFILPSITDRWGDTEGLGVVLLEAMSFGKPVVASKTGGIVDIVKNNENGILVPEKNSKKLAEAIIFLIHHPQKMKVFGQRGLSLVQGKFSWKAVVRETIKAYTITF